jgi:predicted aspartyl protease
MPFLLKALSGAVLLLTATVSPAVAEDVQHSAPIEIVHDKPYVLVMLNGRGPFRFLIDTGTGGEAFITDELADQLNLPTIGHARLGDPSGLGQRRADIVQIQSLSVAGVEFSGVKAIRHSLNGEDLSCQGLLGFTIFKNYLLTIDYPNRRMVLGSGALVADGGRSVLAFRMPDGVPIALMRIGGLRVDAQFDSGGTGLSLPAQIAARLKFSSDPVPFGNGQSLSTRFQIKAGKLRSDVHLGQYKFAQPFVEINPAFPMVNFGSCPMRNFAITFDQANLLVRLTSNQTTLHLAETSTALRMLNAPEQKPRDPQLVPVG